MLRCCCLLLLPLVLLVGCGDEPATPAAAHPVPDWAKVAPDQIVEAKKHGVPVAFENDIGMRFVLIPAGTFTMGSPEDEEGRDDDETQHEVTITKPFYMQTTEVTNGQYRRLKPSHDSGISESTEKGSIPRHSGRPVRVRRVQLRRGSRGPLVAAMPIKEMPSAQATSRQRPILSTHLPPSGPAIAGSPMPTAMSATPVREATPQRAGDHRSPRAAWRPGV